VVSVARQGGQVSPVVAADLGSECSRCLLGESAGPALKRGWQCMLAKRVIIRPVDGVVL
jgi:hypothetical protein